MAEDRRRRYVPVDVYIASRPFGVKLCEKWGMEGLCTWMLLLAAAKREHPQGTFTYASEAEAWTKLGAQALSFTFDEFVTFCGRSRQTKRTCSGRVSYIVLRGWEQWNKEWNTQLNSEQKSRKRGTFTPDIPRTDSGHDSDKHRTEGEAEAEGEYEGEAEARGAVVKQFGLPLSREIEYELERALTYCRDADEGSLAALKAEARGLPLGAVVKVRESAQTRNKRVGVGYVIKALRSEREERGAA